MTAEPHALASTTDPVSQAIVGTVLAVLFILLTLEKAHRVLVALGAASLLWVITYLTPYRLITFEGATRALDFNVLLLLAGMMALVGVLKVTGIFEWMVERVLSRAAGSAARAQTIVIWFTAIASALLDNVTTVIFVTPIAIGMTRSLKVRPAAILLPMIMASNVGGTSTLIGDPPNIMIGSGANLDFLSFVEHLSAPVLAMVVLLQIASRVMFRQDLAASTAGAAAAPRTSFADRAVLNDPTLLTGLMIISAVVLVGFLTHGMTGMPAAVPAIVGAAAALTLQDLRYLRTHGASESEREHGILKILEHEIEWPTLAFFTFLFIIVGAAVETGLVQRVAVLLSDTIGGLRTDFGLSAVATMIVAALLIAWASAILSALIDNIPFVAVSIPIIHQLIPTMEGNAEVLWWALSLGACLGGNATPVGASANVTTLGIAEKAGMPITFRGYMAVGVPIMLFTLVMSSGWIALFTLYGWHVSTGVSLAVAALLGLVAARGGKGG